MLTVQIATQGNFRLEVDLTFPNTISAVFGPSGAGKSTLLRCIAGFEPCNGKIVFENSTWLDSQHNKFTKPNQRPVGYVRQGVQIFPHLTIRENLHFSLRHSKRPSQGMEFDQVNSVLELHDLLDRKPHEISGGETQRVALARTLLAQPQLLLLDEPLTGLDVQRKAEILPYLESLHATYEIPTIYVSHAVDEITVLCSHTVIVDAGRVRGSGPTEEILERQDLADTLGSIEASSIIHARVLDHDTKFHLTTLQVEDHVWSIPRHFNLSVGSETLLRVRARDVALAKQRPDSISVRNVIAGRIASISQDEDGPSADCMVESGNTRIKARITRASLEELDLNEGDQVFALVKSVTLE